MKAKDVAIVQRCFVIIVISLKLRYSKQPKRYHTVFVSYWAYTRLEQVERYQNKRAVFNGVASFKGTQGRAP